VHEMALCEGMMDIICDQQQVQDFQRVKRVIVEIGALGHVDPHALEFAWEVVARGGPAENAALEIIEIPGAGWCMDCSATVTVQRRGNPCPRCGGYSIIVEQGDDMRLKELEVI